MAKREQLIQEIEQVPDDLVQPVLDFCIGLRLYARLIRLQSLSGS
jgi:hypothetical protein